MARNMARSWTGMLNRFVRSTDGAFMVEFGLVFPVLLVLSLGLLEFSLLAFDYQRAAEASRRAVRFAIINTSIPNTAKLLDYDADGNLSTVIVCTSTDGIADCGTSSTATDGDARFQALLANMQEAYPPIQESNVRVTYAATDVGCVDCSGGVLPLVTIEIINLEYKFIVGYLVGLDSMMFPDFKTTVLGSGRIVNAV